jgi:hypothetical protein
MDFDELVNEATDRVLKELKKLAASKNKTIIKFLYEESVS